MSQIEKFDEYKEQIIRTLITMFDYLSLDGSFTGSPQRFTSVAASRA